MESSFLKEGVIFTFSTKQLCRSDKVRFHYSLKGRNGNPGILKETEGKHMGSAVILIPKQYEERVERFMNQWNLPFEKQGIILKE